MPRLTFAGLRSGQTPRGCGQTPRVCTTLDESLNTARYSVRSARLEDMMDNVTQRVNDLLSVACGVVASSAQPDGEGGGGTAAMPGRGDSSGERFVSASSPVASEAMSSPGNLSLGRSNASPRSGRSATSEQSAALEAWEAFLPSLKVVIGELSRITNLVEEATVQAPVDQAPLAPSQEQQEEAAFPWQRHQRLHGTEGDDSGSISTAAFGKCKAQVLEEVLQEALRMRQSAKAARPDAATVPVGGAAAAPAKNSGAKMLARGAGISSTPSQDLHRGRPARVLAPAERQARQVPLAAGVASQNGLALSRSLSVDSTDISARRRVGAAPCLHMHIKRAVVAAATAPPCQQASSATMGVVVVPRGVASAPGCCRLQSGQPVAPLWPAAPGPMPAPARPIMRAVSAPPVASALRGLGVRLGFSQEQKKLMTSPRASPGAPAPLGKLPLVFTSVTPPGPLLPLAASAPASATPPGPLLPLAASASASATPLALRVRSTSPEAIAVPVLPPGALPGGPALCSGAAAPVSCPSVWGEPLTNGVLVKVGDLPPRQPTFQEWDIVGSVRREHWCLLPARPSC